MCNPVRNVAQMKKGENAVVCCLNGEEVTLKLMEMGCLPGTKIRVEGTAPFGDPIKIRIDNEYSLSLRKSEASSIMIR